MPGSSLCPLCGARGRTEAGTQVLPVMDDRQLARALQHLTATYLVCDHCGTVSQHPLPTASALDRYYANTPPPRTVAETTAYKTPVLEDRLDLLQKTTGLTSGRCLEVGCADGALLDLVAARWGLETVGLEPAPSANDRYSSHRIIHGTLADLVASGELEPASCDLVICRHVLEHVHDPALFLDQLAGFVADSGWLLLEVPSSLLLASDGGYHIGQNIHTTHLHHFTGPGLASAITERGLAVVHLSDRDVGRYPCLCLVATGVWMPESCSPASLTARNDPLAGLLPNWPPCWKTMRPRLTACSSGVQELTCLAFYSTCLWSCRPGCACMTPTPPSRTTSCWRPPSWTTTPLRISPPG
ncbi:hypothetical protein GF1_08820 [Desulfolithobacter dissulfuricans]|uniref:Class I SAM-dependent methyltransferase n=1 Tax=Desulfolithobacter dissulfuricans TaxID=2795293 RepID=A0A915TZ56_9BACT|nr:hypothetical protein GF1_08820 [Desulfolithobacter dissulfuricans]